MSTGEHDVKAYLGAGGAKPGFVAVDLAAETWAVMPHRHFFPGDSVYCLAPNPSRSLCAFGTRNGRLSLLRLDAQWREGTPPEIEELDRSSAILSLCWARENLLAVCEKSGACRLWDISEPEASPASLETDGARVCSLLPIADGELLGLSTKGRMIHWSLDDGHILNGADVPAPPGLAASVNMIAWSPETVAYPAEGGGLALYKPQSGDCDLREAHDGDFLAITNWGDELLTAGFSDRRLCRWSLADGKPIEQYVLPERVLSMAALDYEQRYALFADVTGIAWAGTVESNSVVRRYRFEDKDYRTAVGPSHATLRARQYAAQEDQVSRLISDARVMIERGNVMGFDIAICQLTGIGREIEAIELQVDKSINDGDALSEIKARQALTVRLNGSPAAIANRKALAALLRSFLLFSAAEDTLKGLGDETDDADTGKSIVEQGLFAYALVDRAQFETIARAHSLAGSHLKGHYLMAQKGEPKPTKVSVEADRVVALYTDMKRRTVSPVPDASHEVLHLITPDEVREINAVIVSAPLGGDLQGLEVMLRLDDVGQASVVTMYQVYGTSGFGSCDDAEERNGRLLSQWNRLTADRTWMEAWVSPVMKALTMAVQAAATEQGRR